MLRLYCDFYTICAIFARLHFERQCSNTFQVMQKFYTRQFFSLSSNERSILWDTVYTVISDRPSRNSRKMYCFTCRLVTAGLLVFRLSQSYKISFQGVYRRQIINKQVCLLGTFTALRFANASAVYAIRIQFVFPSVRPSDASVLTKILLKFPLLTTENYRRFFLPTMVGGRHFQALFQSHSYIAYN